MPAERVVVIGALGMLGQDLMRVLDAAHPRPDAIVGLDREEIDITDRGWVESVLSEHRPDVVINAAAYTDVDGCETHAEEADRVNREGPGHLAAYCRQSGARLLHISTDFVFDGRAQVPYEPHDAVNPLSVYGKTKEAGEKEIRQILPEALIVRTSWLFGRSGRNFVKTMLKLGAERDELRVVEDQVGCPTYSLDLARALVLLLAKGAKETYHFCNDGACSWYAFTVEILRQAGRKTRVVPITTGELGRPAARPAYSVLSTGRYASVTGHKPRAWQLALRDVLIELGASDPA